MLGKARGRTQRVQIRKHMIRTRTAGMAHQIGEHGIKLGSNAAAPLLGAARPYRVQMHAAGSRICLWPLQLRRGNR